MPSASSLKYLYLKENAITDHGCNALAAVVPHSPTLKARVLPPPPPPILLLLMWGRGASFRSAVRDAPPAFGDAARGFSPIAA